MSHNLIGAEVRKLRDQKNWSQEEFAARLQRNGWDISRGTLAKIEAQIRSVNDAEMLALSQVLEVPVQQLYPAELLRATKARSR